MFPAALAKEIIKVRRIKDLLNRIFLGKETRLDRFTTVHGLA
jgi:hypothetical protein